MVNCAEMTRLDKRKHRKGRAASGILGLAEFEHAGERGGQCAMLQPRYDDQSIGALRERDDDLEHD